MANIIYWDARSKRKDIQNLVFTDTNYLVKLVTPTDPSYPEYNEFHEEMLVNSGTFITSPTVINETWNVLERMKSEEAADEIGLRRHGVSLKDLQKELTSHNIDIKSDVIHWVANTVELIGRDIVTVLDYEEPQEYTKRLARAKRKHHMTWSFDNSHLLYMDSAGCNTIITTDTSFHSVNGLNVIKVVGPGNRNAGKGVVIKYQPEFYL